MKLFAGVVFVFCVASGAFAQAVEFGQRLIAGSYVKLRVAPGDSSGVLALLGLGTRVVRLAGQGEGEEAFLR